MYPDLYIGHLHVQSFGAMLALGYVAVLLMLRRQAAFYRYAFHRLHATTLVAFIGGTIGARVAYMTLVERTFSLDEALNFSHGTMVYGFLIGAAIASSIAIAISRRNIADVLDICVPAWIPMQICGRIGCLLAGCCYGKPSTLPWAMVMRHSHSGAPIDVAVHPTQLYEALALALIFVVLLALRKRRRFVGQITLAYLLMYSAFRFLVEFLRADMRGSFFDGALSTSQLIAFIIIAFAVPRFLASSRSILSGLTRSTSYKTERTTTIYSKTSKV